MKNRILVPLDGSVLAERVLPYVISFARGTGSEVLLLEAVQSPVLVEPVIGAVPVTAGGWDAWEAGPSEARAYLDDVAAQLNERGITTSVLVLEEEPSREIVRLVREHPEISMIAMATHARGGLGLLVLGSVAEKVLHDITIPVLLVHPRESDREPVNFDAPHPINRVVVPLDGSPFAERAIDRAAILATDTGASITLVSVLHGSEGGSQEYLDGQAEKLRAQGLNVDTRLEQGHPDEGILHAATDTNCDLIVMATHGRNGVQRFVVGSIAMKVLHNAKVPVLLVHAREATATRERLAN